MSRLTQAQKDEWLKRLRSGEYIQGKGYLYRSAISGPPKYCCLGVLSLVCGKTEKAIQRASVLDCVGLGDSLHRSEQVQLQYQNDAGGKSFLEIADWIEEKVEVPPWTE